MRCSAQSWGLAEHGLRIASALFAFGPSGVREKNGLRLGSQSQAALWAQHAGGQGRSGRSGSDSSLSVAHVVFPAAATALAWHTATARSHDAANVRVFRLLRYVSFSRASPVVPAGRDARNVISGRARSSLRHPVPETPNFQSKFAPPAVI